MAWKWYLPYCHLFSDSDIVWVLCKLFQRLFNLLFLCIIFQLKMMEEMNIEPYNDTFAVLSIGYSRNFELDLAEFFADKISVCLPKYMYTYNSLFAACGIMVTRFFLKMLIFNAFYFLIISYVSFSFSLYLTKPLVSFTSISSIRLKYLYHTNAYLIVFHFRDNPDMVTENLVSIEVIPLLPFYFHPLTVVLHICPKFYHIFITMIISFFSTCSGKFKIKLLCHQ